MAFFNASKVKKVFFSNGKTTVSGGLVFFKSKFHIASQGLIVFEKHNNIDKMCVNLRIHSNDDNYFYIFVFI